MMSAQGMGLKEETEFKRHVLNLSRSQRPEKHLCSGDLFDLGDTWLSSKKTDEVGTISHIWVPTMSSFNSREDKSVRKWLDDS